MFKVLCTRVLFGLPAVLSVLSTTPASTAQERSQKTNASERTTVNDKDLTAFVRAYVAYHKTRQIYEPRLVKAKDPKEKAMIQREGDAKVTQALERFGLTPQSYNQLFQAINRDEGLRQKALNLIHAERNKP